MLDRLFDDLRQGARVLTRAPALSATAALLVALVVGGNATVYSMLNGAIRRPAPGVTAADLVSFGVVGRPGIPYVRYEDYSAYATASSLRSLAAWGFGRAGVTTPGGTYLLQVTPVTRNYFDTIGIVPATGRAFTLDDDRTGAPLVAVVSDSIWKTHFERAADVVGRRIDIGGRPATIVGVMPAPFAGPSSGEWSDLWVPIHAYQPPGPDSGMVMIGRLASGASVGRVRAEMATLQARLPPLPGEERAPVLVTPYAASAGGVLPAFERQILAIFSIITLLTLAVVGANVANLMLARAVARQRETAIRQSLGASRARLVRLIVAEGVAIAAVACAFAFTLAWWAASFIPTLLPVNRGTMPLDFSPDWRVAVYAVTLTLLGTILSSLIPSLRTWKQDALPSLKDGGHTTAPGRSRLSATLVVVQLAFSVLLLTVGVLAYRSWSQMSGDRIGFETRGLLLVNVGTSTSAPSEEVVLLERIRERLATLPTVASVSYTRDSWRSQNRGDVRSIDSIAPVPVTMRTIGLDYFRTLGVKPIAGRDLAPADWLRSGGAAVVNRALATALFPDRDAVGETVIVGGARDAAVEIVGVVPDLFYRGFDPERPDQRPHYMFITDRPAPAGAPPEPEFSQTTFHVRYTGTLDAVSAAVPAALDEVDSRIALASRETLDARLEQQALSARLISTLLAIFAGLSLLIAAIGQYAAVAFETRRRTRDFGVRIALGASARQIVGAVLRGGAGLTLAGLAAGFMLSAGVATVLRGVLFGITPADPATYLAVFVLLACVSLFACYLPARRASRIDPVQALRQE